MTDTVKDHAIRTNDSFAGDFTIQFTFAGGSSFQTFGVYDISEDGTFNENATSNAHGSLSSMSNSWFVDKSATDWSIYKGNTVLSSAIMSSSAGQVYILERTGTTMTFKSNGSTIYTWSNVTGEVRFVIADGGTDTLNYDDISWSYAASAGDMTLISAASEAIIEPGTGYLMFLVEQIDAVTYNTDLLFDLSKDNGVTWEAVTASVISQSAQGYDVVYGAISFVASGDQTMRYRLRSLNSKHIKVHGAIMDAEG